MDKTTITFLLILIYCAAYAQQNPRSFIFENGNWSPNAPFDVLNPSTEIDSVEIKNGTAEFSGKTVVSQFHVATAAKFTASEAKIYLSGNLLNEGFFDGKNSSIYVNGGSPQIFSGNGIALGFLFLEDFSELILQTEVSIYENLKLKNALLTTNDLLTLKSILDNPTDTVKDAVVFSEDISLVDGDVTVEKFIPARRTQKFIASAVTTSSNIFKNWQENGESVQGFGTLITGNGGIINGFDASASNNASAFVFDPNTQQYNAITNTKNLFLNAGEVFRIYISGDRNTSIDNLNDPATNTILRSKGELNFGDYKVHSVSEQKNGITLVGNPYQAYVDIKKVLERSKNVNQRYYHIWDPTINKRGAFVTVDLNSNSNTTIKNLTTNTSIKKGVLFPGQAIFTNTLENGTTEITFKETDKISINLENLEDTTTTTSNIQNKISIYLYEGSENRSPIDGTHISFSEGETNSVNNDDGLKYYNVDETIASVVGNRKLSFQNRDTPMRNDVIPLFITNYRGTQYKLKIMANNFSANTKPYLKDNFLNTTIPLENGEQEIGFNVENANSSILPNRFSIIFENLLAINENLLASNLVRLAPNPARERVRLINGSTSKIEKIKIYDITGKQIKTIDRLENSESIDVSDLKNSIYFLDIMFEDKSSIIKKLVKI